MSKNSFFILLKARRRLTIQTKGKNRETQQDRKSTEVRKGLPEKSDEARKAYIDRGHKEAHMKGKKC